MAYRVMESFPCGHNEVYEIVGIPRSKHLTFTGRLMQGNGQLRAQATLRISGGSVLGAF